MSEFRVTWRDERIALGLSQSQLAEKLEVTQAYISAIEKRIKSPSLLIAARMASILKIPPSKFEYLSKSEFYEFNAVYILARSGDATNENAQAMVRLIEFANGEKKPYVSSNSLPKGDERVRRIRAQFSKKD